MSIISIVVRTGLHWIPVCLQPGQVQPCTLTPRQRNVALQQNAAVIQAPLTIAADAAYEPIWLLQPERSMCASLLRMSKPACKGALAQEGSLQRSRLFASATITAAPTICRSSCTGDMHAMKPQNSITGGHYGRVCVHWLAESFVQLG